MNRTTHSTSPVAPLAALALALAVPLAACSSSSTSTPATTTAAPTTAAPSTTTAGGSSTGSRPVGTTSGAGGGASGGSSTGGSSAGAFSCDGVAAEIPAVWALPVDKMDSVGSTCTATLAEGDQVEVVWNSYAADETSFGTISSGLDPAEVSGATKAVAGVDSQGAQVVVLVGGKGSYQLYLTPEFTSARAADQGDVDKLKALAAALIVRG